MADGDSLLLPEVRRIAVLRPNALGDFIFSLPSLHALKAAYPAARLTYIGRQWHADFLRGRPGPVDEVEIIPPFPGVGLPPEAQVDTAGVQSFLSKMREKRFDLAVQVYGGGRYSNPFIKQFGARLTIGWKAPDAEPLDRWVCYGRHQNRRLHMLETVSLAGATTFRFEQELAITEQDRKEAEIVLGVLPSKPLVVIQPGASDPRRHWPAECFAAVGDRLVQEGATVAVSGTEEEGPVVRAVLEKMRSPALDLSGRLSLSGLCGVLERASLLVSNDTGPLHLAVAIGTPCVGVYWLTNLVEAGPLRQHTHKAALSLRTRCPVCGQDNIETRCPHQVSFVDDVPLDEVMRMAVELFTLSRQGGGYEHRS